MKKNRFFYLKRFNIVLLILWLGIINEALTLNLEYKEKQSDIGNINEEQNDDAGETSDKTIIEDLNNAQNAVETMTQSQDLSENVEMIRVLLMNSGYESYYHPAVTVQYDGKEETYTMESEMLQDGEIIIECDDEGITILSLERQQGNPTYNGKLEIRKTDKGLLLINELPMESYLEAVVPSEMPSSYEPEALKAQAVCARTYAYKQMEKQSLQEYDADVDDSVNYQVYGNVACQESTSEAVQETEGKVMLQNDELIEAYYFSTSSGQTSTNEVWGVQEAASYLKSVECAFDANEAWSNWKVQIPWKNLENMLRTSYDANAELINLQLNRKSQSGAVIEMEAVTDQGNYLISGEYDVRAFLSPNGCEITSHDEEKRLGGTLLPSAYFDMEIVSGEYVEITGRGYGHGVGMSQNAADEMAKQGYTWEEILEYFFKDVEITEYV